MTTENEEQVKKRWKKIALASLALFLILLVVAMIWWGNLADSDIEEGPVGPVEAVTDSADDRGEARPD